MTYICTYCREIRDMTAAEIALSRVPCESPRLSGQAVRHFNEGTSHFAKVQSNGLLKDSKGRVHLTVEDWLKRIVGKNIPISSAYAWDKVTFKGRPLSHHWANVEQMPCVEKELYNSSVLDTATAVADGLTLVMKIKVLHMVGNDEMVPNALMDQYWEQLVKDDSWTV